MAVIFFMPCHSNLELCLSDPVDCCIYAINVCENCLKGVVCGSESANRF